MGQGMEKMTTIAKISIILTNNICKMLGSPPSKSSLPGVMFPKPELQPDGPPDGGNVSFTLRQANLDQIPNHLRKPAVKK